MKATTLITLLAVAVSSPLSVMADSCNRGGVYCGVSLINKGNYEDDIIRSLQENGKPVDQNRIYYSLFDCLEGGNIRYRTYCSNGCGGTDSKDPDYCF